MSRDILGMTENDGEDIDCDRKKTDRVRKGEDEESNVGLLDFGTELLFTVKIDEDHYLIRTAKMMLGIFLLTRENVLGESLT